MQTFVIVGGMAIICLWFRKAAEQGNAFAQHTLGKMYRDGVGVTKDLNEARKWFEKAAAGGHGSTQSSEYAKKALENL